LMGIEEVIDSLFRLAYIERWNDHPRPFSITELDKQAHKACIAFLFAKMEEKERQREVDWIGLVNGLLFEAFQRSVLTDIKPRLFHRVLKFKRDEINEYVLQRFKDVILAIDPNLFKEMSSYFNNDRYLFWEKRIITAAHFIATYWEFQFVYQIASGIYGIEETKREIDNRIEEFIDLIGVQKFLLQRKTHGFIDICGQLRFQRRWIQTPRIPQTSVLGHTFMVAVLAYMLAREKSRCKNSMCNLWWYGSFFASLFHDLPEIATRDIISNVKDTLGKEIVREMELEEMERRILPLLPSYMIPEMKFFLGIANGKNHDRKQVDEFSDRVFEDGTLKLVEDITTYLCKSSSVELIPIDGRLLKLCDKLVAFSETVYSLSHGVRSAVLKEAFQNLYRELQQEEEIRELVNSLYARISK